MKRLTLFLALFLLACASDADHMQFELRPLAATSDELAVCYGPHREGQRPGVSRPSKEELREDLRLIASRWPLLRIYGSSEFAEDLLAIVREEKHELRVILGAWIAVEERRDESGQTIDKDASAASANRAEVAAAIRLANAYPEIVAGVSVGNETQVFWTPHRSPMDIVIRYVRQVRAAIAQPVTSADDYNFWNKPESRAMAAEVDFLLVHAHPMWNGVQLEEAVPWLAERIAEIEELHPDRPVVIGETGWATKVHDEGEQAELIKGAAGEAEQAIFYREIREWSRRENRICFFFEAFDEKWKGGSHPNEVEKHWGLYAADRTPKAAIVD